MSFSSLLQHLNNRPWRLFSLFILGFASGLPLALTGQALQAWLTTAGLTTAAIGMFALVTQPYAYKFMWAPLMDRFEPPFLGRRRGWLVLTQLMLAALILGISQLDPVTDTISFSMMALGIAFLSSSQDIVIDAYRTDIAPKEERGLSASMGVFGYRLGMIVSGGVAFIMADAIGWQSVYHSMALIMIGLAVFTVFTPVIPTDETHAQRKKDFSRFVAMMVAAGVMFFAVRSGMDMLFANQKEAFGSLYHMAASLIPLFISLLAAEAVGKKLDFADRKDITGFIYMLIGTLIGYYLGDMLAQWLKPFSQAMLTNMGLSATAMPKWQDLFEVLIILSLAIPGAYHGAKLAKFDLLILPMQHFFSREAAWAFLWLIIFYKLGDAFAGNLSTNFLIKGAQFSQTEIGLVNKMLGMFATIGGTLLGGILMLRLGLFRSLLLFGILQGVSNLGFWALAEFGKDAWGHMTIPTGTFTQIITNSKSLVGDIAIDNLLMFVVCFENITGGMGTAAFVALLMSLASGGHSLTHYALLSAFASVGRIYVGPVSGVLAETLGWPNFFLFATLMAIPGLWLLWQMRQKIMTLS